MIRNIIIPGCPLWMIAVVVMTGLSCAKQGYPPGGPLDKTPPKVVKTVPALNSLNALPTDPLVFEFSETMDDRSVEENIFIVPIPPVWPEFQWRSRNKILMIRPSQPLRDNTTYVITIGTKAQDLRRNGLEESVILCFSTGGIIENKKIRGTAVPPDMTGGRSAGISEVDIVAFRLNGRKDPPDPRNDVPDYFSQTGQNGTYEIAGLSSGLFRLFAIGDRDKDGFYSEGYDLFGIMPKDVEISDADSVVYAPDVVVSPRLTSDIQLTSIKAHDNRRIELFFDREIEIPSLRIKIEGLDVLGRYAEGEPAKSVVVVTGQQESRKKYTFAEFDVLDRDGNHLTAFDIQPFFTGTDRADTTALAVVDRTPGLLDPGAGPVTVTFNRMLDLPPDMTGIIGDESGQRISVRGTGPNKLELTSPDGWQSAVEYVILFDREQMKDIAGNTLSEEGARLSFRVVPSDTLGFIEGTVEDHTVVTGAAYRLYLRNLDTGTGKLLVCEHPGEWGTGPVIPGHYRLTAHRDDDGDGIVFRGLLNPYKPAEQVVVYPDTLMVEPRWPVKDVSVVFR